MNSFKVISTNSDTFETAHKTVLETCIRKVNKLVYLTIAGALIITTVDHPFYVRNQDFVSASELQVGYETVNSNGDVLLVEDIRIEDVDGLETVYNFQVEDFHTYHVSELGVLVHNAGDDYINADGSIKWPTAEVVFTDGFDGDPIPGTLEPGTTIDRYGYDNGKFVSPEGTPYEARSLAPGTETKPYNCYEVAKPIDVNQGKAAPWFDQPGGGTQFKLPDTVKNLIDNGFLKKI